MAGPDSSYGVRTDLLRSDVADYRPPPVGDWPSTSPCDYPDDHPGWDALMYGLARTMRRHPPDHDCMACIRHRNHEET